MGLYRKEDFHKHCGPNKHREIKKLLKKESGSTSEGQDNCQVPPPPPPRSQPSTHLNVQEQLQQLKPIVPQLTIQDPQPASQQTFQDFKPAIQDSQSVRQDFVFASQQPFQDSQTTIQDSQSGVQDSQSEIQDPHSTMQDSRTKFLCKKLTNF